MGFLRKLLFPFSILYGGITAIRNLCYDLGLLKSKSYDLPIICVGNLSTGGTGKSPMIEFLISFLSENHKIAVLSRGYKRKTKGFYEVLQNSRVEEVGDEPLQFKKKFPEVSVAVCEDRQTGIEKLKQQADIILLDDAFQHRKVKASLNVLLTSYGKLYRDDCLLPTGNLRESILGAKRADIIVVTKCPDTIDGPEMEQIKQKLRPKPNQEIYFSKIAYGESIKNTTDSQPLSYLKHRTFLLVSGIANPQPLVSFLKRRNMNFRERLFQDHHNFTPSEIQQISKEPLVLTTEKDFMRLQSLADTTAIYYVPITTEFVDDMGVAFKKRVENAIAE